MRILLRRKDVDGVGSRYLLEWNPENGRWYPINYKNVHPSRLQETRFTSQYRDVMNRILKGETLKVGADYNREKKILTIIEVASNVL